jgi:superfamily II DNA/RNA helicase
MPNIKASVFFGGLPIVQDRATLKKDPPHIVIGTPGRILALANEKALDLKKIKFFVLDECDSLLEPIGTAPPLPLSKHQKPFANSPTDSTCLPTIVI